LAGCLCFDSIEALIDREIGRRRFGGHSIAVYNPEDKSRTSFRKAFQLSGVAGRIKHIAPADYRPGGHLRLITAVLQEVFGMRGDPNVGQ